LFKVDFVCILEKLYVSLDVFVLDAYDMFDVVVDLTVVFVV
jgi:hypothetical protein